MDKVSKCLRCAGKWLLAASAAVPFSSARAQITNYYEENILPTPSLYGGMGLLDTRNARFMPDGYLALNVDVKKPDDRFTLTFQALPWLEASFRYTVNYALAPIGQRALYDRSFDLKARLFEESQYFPQVAVGLQDFIGTGFYSAEYLVASKRFGPVDVTSGMGWGRLASRPAFPNPLGLLWQGFNTRPGDTSTTGGQPLFSNFFRGPNVGIFGGIEYDTPIRNLKFKVEYSSDSYAAESRYRQNRSIKPMNYAPVPVNTGFSYRFFHNVDLSAALVGGREFSLDASIAMNPAEPNWSDRIDPQPPFVSRPKGSYGQLTQLDLDNDGSERTRVHFVDLTSLADPTGRPPDPALFHSGEIRIAGAFSKAGLHIRDGWLTGDTLVAQIEGTQASPTLCERIVSGDGLPARQVILVGEDWNPLAICNAPAPRPDPASAPATPSPVAAWQAGAVSHMRDAIAQQQLIVEGLSIKHGIVKVEIENDHYLRDAEAISRTLRALSASAPPDIGAFEVTTSIAHMPLTRVTVSRSEVDALARAESTPGEVWKAAILSDAPEGATYKVRERDPQFSWSIFPAFQDDLFDPNNPVYLGIGIAASTRTELFPGFVIDDQLTQDIWNNFSSITRTSNSLLPHVRSDIASYLKQSTTAVTDLTATYFYKPAPEIYARLSAGYIEQMFGGVGGEVLYRPFGQRWAVGADLYEVYQRNFNDLFGFQNYHVLTGHVSLYVETPWDGLTTTLRAGRYLAGDYGATFEIDRRFDSGFVVGAWATFTNVPFSQFGEGSFDKGIKLIIPLEWALPFGTTSKYELDLRPLQRDGGQPLNNDAELYDMTQTSSYGDLERQWPNVLN
ncbi:MAG TPA: YjbH domain-containing protein [Rhizomicrobium sp.]